MTPAETTTILRQFNEWRRGADVPQPKPREICEAIDAAVEMIERLEDSEQEKERLFGLAHDQNRELVRLREECRALRAENGRMDEAMESLLIRCDDSDSAMYGTLSTSFVRDTVRIARAALEKSK